MDTTQVHDAGQQAPQAVERLTDGDTKTVVQLEPTADGTIELIYALGDEPVSAERLIVTTADGIENDQSLNIEVLASTLSPDAGFQSLRSAQVRASNRPQTFRFLAHSARWLMLRIAFDPSQEQHGIAEVNVIGYAGAPQTTYAFKESPVDSLIVLNKLKQLTNVNLSDDERSLFDDAKDGKLDDWSFAEAALIASGATDPTARNPLLREIDRFETNAEAELEALPNTFAKGERLLQSLHQRLLTGGYSEKQTDLTRLLTSKTYNCVSSATLYNILGKRLGLDVRGVEVPDHAFSILYDGSKHADIEVTNAKGFNPSRNRRALDAFQQQTGFRYIPDMHPGKRREVSDAGMVALIYYNHGVSHAEKKEYGKALVRFFCALSLDPEFHSATKNALSTIGNWSLYLTKDEKWDEAIQVINAGIELAPKDASLVHNRNAIWHQRVESVLKTGDKNAAVALLREADRQVPDGDFIKRQAWIYLKSAQQRASEEKWDEAIEIADSGLEHVDEPARDVLQTFITAMFLRSGNAQLQAGDFPGTIATLERGLKRSPDDRKLHNNLAFTIQQWYQHQTTSKKDSTVVSAEVERLIKAYPHINDLQRVANNSAFQTARQLADKGQFKEALDVLDRSTLVPPKDIARFKRSVYDRWAKDFVDKKDWEQANKIYAAGVADCPDNFALRQNAIAVALNWGNERIKAKDWAAAVKACQYGNDTYDDYRFRKNLGYVAQEWLLDLETSDQPSDVDAAARDLVRQFPEQREVRASVTNYYLRRVQSHLKEQNTDAALLELDRGIAVFPTAKMPKDFARTGGRMYGNLARDAIRKKQWQDTIKSCQTGLSKFPDDRNLTTLLSKAYNDWIDELEKDMDYPAAVDVCEKAIKSLPNDVLFKLVLKNLQRQSKK